MIILVTCWSKVASFWIRKLIRKSLMLNFSSTGIFNQWTVKSYFRALTATNWTNLDKDCSMYDLSAPRFDTSSVKLFSSVSALYLSS